jgi:hypothetical protein
MKGKLGEGNYETEKYPAREWMCCIEAKERAKINFERI